MDRDAGVGDTLARLRDNWDRIKGQLVRAVDRRYGVFVPTSSRPPDPATPFGAAVLNTAREYGIDPHALAEATDYIHRTERKAGAARREAVRATRLATGLTPNRVGKLLDAGKDHLDVPGLDVMARALAGEYPDLGIGRGYDPDAPDDDYAPPPVGRLGRTRPSFSGTTRTRSGGRPSWAGPLATPTRRTAR